MTPTTSMLVGCVLQVTLFSVLAGAAYLVARHVAAGAAGALLAGSLALVLGLTLLAGSPWPRWEWRATPPTEVAVVAETPAAENPSVETEQTAATPDPELASPYAAAWEAFTGALAAPPRAAPIAGNRPLLSWTNGFWLLAGAGLVVSAGRLVWGVWQVQKLVRRSRPVTDAEATAAFDELVERLSLGEGVALRECPDLATPATVGWRRPQVLLPGAWTEWSGDELRAAMAHELAHVAARDYRSWLVARLAVAVHFYHPLVRWLAGRLQLEQELAADAAAARLVGDRQNYLACLASLALSTPPERLAGPASTLFPSRSLLMRRVEMLRSNMGPRLGLVSGWLRGASIGLMALVALGVAGLRQPAAVAEEKPAEYDVISFAEETPERIPLSVVPADAILVVSARPSELLADPGFQPLVEELDKSAGLTQMGLSVRDIEEIIHTDLNGLRHLGGRERVIIRGTTPEACRKMANFEIEQSDLKKVSSSPETWQDENDRLIFLDNRTYVTESDAKEFPPLYFPGEPEWSAEWRRQAGRQFVVMTRIASMRQAVDRNKSGKYLGEIGFLPMEAFRPLIDHTDWAIASVDLRDRLTLNAVAKCDDEEHAGRIAKMTQGLIAVSGGMLEQLRAESFGEIQRNATLEQIAEIGPILKRALSIARSFVDDAEPVANGDRVTLSYTTDKLNAKQAGEIAAVLTPAFKAAGFAAKRTQSTNNLRFLALAMHNYHDTYGHFPPAVLYKKGSPHPYSWRVALLPYLEQQAVYDAYNFDEPWDSPANKVLAEVAIPTFQSPFDDPGSANTSYFVLTGPGTVFDGKEGTRFADITDGTSKTLMIVEAKRAVPWTKPEDIPYAADKPLPELGGWMPGMFLTAWCDGHALVVDKDVDEADLRAAISRDGKEVIDFYKWNASTPKSQRQ